MRDGAFFLTALVAFLMFLRAAALCFADMIFPPVGCLSSEDFSTSLR
jgi:hypothetical protein